MTDMANYNSKTNITMVIINVCFKIFKFGCPVILAIKFKNCIINKLKEDDH